MELIMLVGAPGSGKSTFCLQHFHNTHIRLNLDMLGTRHRENILFRACLEAKQPVCIDNTNLTARVRARFLGPARAARFSCKAYVLDTTLEACLAYNEGRPDKTRVPDQALRSMYRKLEPPTQQEGFDEVIMINRYRRP